MVAMSHRRSGAGRVALVMTSAAAVLAASAGCSSVVAGRAILAEPQIGQPAQWGPCRPSGGGGNALPIPSGAQCGKIAVPVNYDNPDAGTATLALIRFPATGERIGSLIINPGGPGESGIEAATGIVEGMPASVRERFDLVGFDPRGVAASTPASCARTSSMTPSGRWRWG